MSTEDPGTNGPDYRLLALAAIVPVLIIGAVLIRVVVNRPHDSNAHPGTLTLTVPEEAPTAGCGPADATTLAKQATAVEATVTSVSGSTITLQPKRFFRGEQAEEVQVREGTSKPPAALKLPTFSTGATYLLAGGADGTLTGCGLSGQDSSSLEKLYTSAFG